MDSLWFKDVSHPHFGSLNGDKSTDVLIIGGGIAGIMCALKLKNKGVDCLLVEANEICSGVTGNTTAKITVQHGLIYADLIKRFGEGKAKLYLDAQLRAAEEYDRLCREIDCGYATVDSYVYSMDDKKKLEEEAIALNKLGIKAELVNRCDLPFDTAGAVRVKDQGQFHPLKLLYAVARELPIYEHTKITSLLPSTAETCRGKIKFNKAVVATHFPMLNKHGAFFLKLYQHRSYVLALENAEIPNGMYVDESATGLSFRPYGDILLLGGGGHRTGKDGGCWQVLEEIARKYYPNAREIGRWATQDCMTLDKVPYIGKYSKNTHGIYVATGFNKWGMTNAVVSADILCDLILGKSNDLAEVFSPSRSILTKQLAVNAAESAMGLLTPTVPRCPHLGCALKYNRAEHTWDCPCHGSRFTEHGELIDNPATDDHKTIGK